MLWLSLPLHKVVVATTGYFKELTHNRYRILVPVTIYYCILYLWPHILSADCRKSRNNLFSIRSRSSSFCTSCLGGWPSLRGRPLALGSLPFRVSTWRLLYLVTHHSICFSSMPNSSAISRRVYPASRIDRMTDSYSLILVYLLLPITIPPNVRSIILH